jgi:uncharacterized iron-regulated membrane protein
MEMTIGTLDRKRRIPYKRISGWLHLWLGLASGLIVFTSAVTGCLYAFEKEIRELAYADRLWLPSGSGTGAPALPLSVLWEKAQQALGPEHPITRVEMNGDAGRSYAFAAFQGNPKALTYFGETVYNYKAYLNPYDGRILELENGKYEFFTLVLRMHWSLLLSNRIGQPIIGTAVLIFTVMLITGMVLWWPRNRAALKARLRVDWRARWKRLNWDLHAVAGVYACGIALVIALTGLTWAFKWFNDSVYFLAMGGKGPVKEGRMFSDTAAAAALRPIDSIFIRSQAEMPGYRELSLSVPDKKAGVVSVIGRFGKQSHYDTRRLQFDRYSGKRLKSKAFADLNRGEKLKAMNYDLHTGSILGLAGKFLAFFAGLVCASLPVSGLLIWLGKKRGKKPEKGRIGKSASNH